MMIDLSSLVSAVALGTAVATLVALLRQVQYDRVQAHSAGEQVTLQRIEVIHASEIANLQGEIVELKAMISALEANAKIANRRADAAERELENLRHSFQRGSGDGTK